jgi:hypothetical protein
MSYSTVHVRSRKKGWKSQTKIQTSQEQSGGLEKSCLVEVAASHYHFLTHKTKPRKQFLRVRFQLHVVDYSEHLRSMTTSRNFERFIV